MAANSAQQRKILRDYKYPDPEGRAQQNYYQKARNCIRAYHKNGHNQQWLIQNARSLATQAEGVRGQARTKLNNNSRAIRQYAKHFSDRDFEPLENIKLSLEFPDVKISVYPDLRVIEKGKEKIIKLEFVKEEPDKKIIKIITQALFEAQVGEGMGLTSASVLYLDVPRGAEHRGARIGSRLNSEMMAACENIAAIWESI